MDMVTLAMAKAYSDSKGGYTEKGWKTIFDTKGLEIDFEVNSNGTGDIDMYPQKEELPVLAEFDVGDVCKVIFDGVEYICTVGSSGEGERYIGDYDGNDEAIPFCFVIFDMQTQWRFSVYADNIEPSHSFALYVQTETIHPIDPKYLPSGSGGGLPKIEVFFADPDNGTTELTPEQINVVKAAAVDGMPLLVSCDMGGVGKLGIIANTMYIEVNSVYGAEGSAMGQTLVIEGNDEMGNVAIMPTE